MDNLENEGAEGVELLDLRLCALLYADDLILSAENENDVKKQMQALGNYANEWNLELSPVKSKVMIFNDQKRDDFFRKMNNLDIYITKSYKYWGVLINNKHSYKGHIDMIVEKANNCLFSLLKKSKEWRGFDQT